MSIYGIGGANIGRVPGQMPSQVGGRPPVQPPATGAPSQAPKPNAASVGKPAPGVPVEAPEGTDPALWSVLSNEERAFFAKAGAMGPLTYGKALREMSGTPLPANRGGRLDVKG
jgi:hypothetical protein